ncbi:MAG: PrsW family glutamic-type intramembrane protease [Methanomicrobiales archaeon]|nr:PrsW family glutamic-type intramembrane protease [Methanomicrobiales archaeon]MDI6875181.1 PrsW family glutamic-type intramembrane protease [Methanomicrobiales archaeon]
MHITLTVFAIGFAPGVFWLWYFYSRDRIEPEPRAMVARIFLYGILIAFPVAIIEGILAGVAGILFTSAIGAFLLAVAIAPLVEEYAKFCVVRNTVYENREFSEPMDGILYGAAAALGFAAIENAWYILYAFLSSPVDAVTTYTFRALVSVPAHPLISSMWGFSLGQAKFGAAPNPEGAIVRGLLLAMFFHSVFNLLASIQLFIGLVALVFFLVPILWLLVNRNIRTALEENP